MDASVYLIHRLLDTSVEESVRIYDQWRELGLPVELSLLEGEGHCFECKREGPGIIAILGKAANFLAKCLEWING